MKNQKFFDELIANGFDAKIHQIVAKEFKPNYSLLVEFNDEDETVIVANHYHDLENKHDWPKRNVIFCGKCTDLKEFVKLAQILNMEVEAKNYLGKLEIFG